MLRTLAFAALGVAMVSFASHQAQAIPMSNPLPAIDSSDVTLVAQGCGRGWHRGPGGVCRRNAPAVVAPAVVAPVVVAPVVVAPRVCPRGFHLSPRGVCVRNY
jgi:hypothetical protein